MFFGCGVGSLQEKELYKEVGWLKDVGFRGCVEVKGFECGGFTLLLSCPPLRDVAFIVLMSLLPRT